MCWTLVSFDLLILRQSVGYLSIHWLLLICWYCLPICSLFGDIVAGYMLFVCQPVNCARICLQYNILVSSRSADPPSICWLSVNPPTPCQSACIVCPFGWFAYGLSSCLISIYFHSQSAGRYADVINRLADCVSMCWWAMCWSPGKDQMKKNHQQKL